MKKIAIVIVLLCCAISLASAQDSASVQDSATVQTRRYEADWDSLRNDNAPEWYEDAKLEFRVPWGVYSVPAFKGDHAGEWYGHWMHCKEGQSSRNNQGLATHLHHTETYGDPSEFGYKDLIPMFTAENFDADQWADLCVEGGAKIYIGTSQDIRFTQNKANTVLYATALDWPGESMLIQTLAGADLTDVKSGRLLGTDDELKWKQTAEGMEISMPGQPDYGMAYPVRIEFVSDIASASSN